MRSEYPTRISHNTYYCHKDNKTKDYWSVEYYYNDEWNIFVPRWYEWKVNSKMFQTRGYGWIPPRTFDSLQDAKDYLDRFYNDLEWILDKNYESTSKVVYTSN